MAAEWRPDPFERAHLNPPPPDPSTLYAGAAFAPTNQIPPGYPGGIPYPAWAMAPQRKGGRLIAAGVLGLITGVVALLGAISMLILRAHPTEFCDNSVSNCSDVVVNTGLLTTLAIGNLVLAALFLPGGVGGCMRKHWGQSTLVAAGALGIALYVIGALSGGSIIDAIVPIVWFAIVLGLASANDRADYELPKH